MIDAGHGGYDPGAIGSRSREKDNVLKVALRLKSMLESYGHTVRLTRSTDVYLTLSERARLANVWGADYFLSLHDNSATNKTATGFETFIHDGPVQKNTPIFQNAIHSEIIKGIGISDRGKKRANFGVLRLTRMPAVLIEYAFISNYSEETLLINEVEKMAVLTANGVVKMAGGQKPIMPPKKEDPTLPKDDGKHAKANASHLKSQEWAMANGISDGMYPAKNVTREQVWTMLHRMFNLLNKK